MKKQDKKKIGIAVIGCGGIANAHFRAICTSRDVKLVAVCDVEISRAIEASKKYRAEKVYTSWQSVWNDAEIEAVILPLPHHLHAPAAIEALNSGRHVLVEKPIANTVKEADKMIAAAKKNKRVLMVGHMKRYNRAYYSMYKNVNDGNIGVPYMCRATWYGPREIMPGIPWVMKKKTGGGGTLMGFGTHHIDVFRWALGEIKEVSCYTKRAVTKQAEAEDTAVVSMRFKSGVVGTIDFTWARSPEDFFEEIRILGSKGETAVIDGAKVLLASEPRFGDRKIRELNPDKEAKNLSKHQFNAQLAHFIECIRTGKTPVTDGNSGRKTVAVIEAAYKSAETGKPVIVK